jgi:hypothetical protein
MVYTSYTSDDKALEALIAGQITPPEIDNDEVDQDRRAVLSFYESSSINILGKMNTDEFRNVYMVLKHDILERSDELKRIFLEKYLDQMSGVYGFEFPTQPEYDTRDTILKMFKFIEFVEFDV